MSAPEPRPGESSTREDGPSSPGIDYATIDCDMTELCRSALNGKRAGLIEMKANASAELVRMRVPPPANDNALVEEIKKIGAESMPLCESWLADTCGRGGRRSSERAPPAVPSPGEVDAPRPREAAADVPPIETSVWVPMKSGLLPLSALAAVEMSCCACVGAAAASFDVREPRSCDSRHWCRWSRHTVPVFSKSFKLTPWLAAEGGVVEKLDL